MGLDVAAYRGLRRMDCVYDEHGEPIDPATRAPMTDAVILRANSEYEAHASDVPDGAYSYADAYRFRAGSYGYYNSWRDALAKLVGWPEITYQQYNRDWPSAAASAWKADRGPMWELINFSDCEGVIGTAACQKLAREFAEYQTKADAHPDENFREAYAEWRKAVEMAADGGALDFH